MKKIFVFLGIVIVLGAGVFLFVQHTSATKEVAEEFTYEVLSRGDIQNLVSSTGTLKAVGTVELGSQIAGTVDHVYVDYNDRVKKGQLLAVIDKMALEASVRDAEANLARSEAQLKQAQTEYERNKKLFDEGLIAEINFLEKETAVETAAASVKSAQASLERNQTNLKYAEIRSPITGTVIERAVEAGQTISTNNNDTLFIIAEDLAQMQIEALVDESDIGQIKDGMAVRFTVQAYPDDEFTGTVRQIRLNPTVQQDVVNYTVIVDARNATGKLLPGMTATVDFIVEERFDVLHVPNTALYFQPSQEILAELQSQFQGQHPTSPVNGSRSQTAINGTAPQPSMDTQGNMPPVGMPPATTNADRTTNPSELFRQRPAASRNQSGTPGQSGEGTGNGQSSMQTQSQMNNQGTMIAGGNFGNGQITMNTVSGSNGAGKMSRVFYLDNNGKLAMARFTTGATDGANTEVLQSAQLVEGMRIVTGIDKTAQTAEKASLLSSLRLPGFGGGSSGGRTRGMDGPPPGGPF